MRKAQRHTGLFLVVLLLTGSLTWSSSAWAGKKKTHEVKIPKNAVALDYTDSLRYNYFFLEAVRQQNAGHFAAAFDLLNHCLAIDSCAAEAYYMQARYFSHLGKDSLALHYLKTAALLRPDNGTYQEKVAQFYIGMGNYDKAIEAYERLYAAQHDRSDVVNILVDLYKQQKDYDNMLGAIDRLERIEGENEQFDLARMRVYELKGDAKNAYKTLKSLADTHPNDMSFSIMLGNWLMQNKKPKDAYKLFSRALENEPENTYAQSSMYDYYRAVGQDEKAKKMMERILLGKNTPADNRVQFIRQAIQENERQGGDSMKIIRLFDRLREALPTDASIAEMKAAYYTLKKMPEEDINRALVELLAIAPDNSGARFQLIQNKWAKQNWKEVAEWSEPGMLYNPDEMAFYYFTGLARYYQKDDVGALDAFQRGTAEINAKSDPDIVSDFYAIMGEIYHNQGRKEEAYAAFDSCLQWKPDHIVTLNNYAYFLSVEGKDLKRAEEMSAKAVKAEPKNPTYLDTYAWILYCQERYAEAKIYIDQTLKYSEDSTLSADVLEHAGDIYIKTGDTEEALQMWQKAIDVGGDAAVLNKKKKRYSKKK
ncbi:MAG: tetratricopeptide repeat protein [Prevotella sp.]|jgi:tetratricopeptide (TPR) repeat protein